MVFWVTLGVLFVLLIVLWILWSAFDKAVSPKLCYSQSSFNSSVLKHCPMLLSPYVPTWFWGKSGHIQTILYGKMGRVNSPMPRGCRCAKLLADGATITYDIFQPLGNLKTGGDSATLLVCPGIANSSESVYICTFVYHAQQNGFSVAVLNHLGALADVPLTSPRIYTYGGTEEYGVMVDEMMQKFPDSKFIAVGFSMGGNIVVKYLGEHEDIQSRFTGAISCCQGYNLVQCTPLLLQWRGGRYFYIRAMTEHQKRILRRHKKVLFGDESVSRFGSFDVDKIFAASTLLDLDVHYSYRRAGFQSCVDYYSWCSSHNYIHMVNIPMLLLNASDDPIVPPELHYIPRQFALKRDNVIFAVTHHGGHLGYFEGGVVLPSSVTWLDRIVVEFSTALLCCADLNSHEPSSAVKSSLTNDINSNDEDASQLQQQKELADESPASPAVGTDAVDKLAVDLVNDVLRSSTSVICDDMHGASWNGSLPSNSSVVLKKSLKTNHSVSKGKMSK